MVKIEFTDGTESRECETLAEAQAAMERYGYFAGATYECEGGHCVHEYWHTTVEAEMEQSAPAPACTVEAA